MRVAEAIPQTITAKDLREYSSEVRRHARMAVEAARDAILRAERAVARSREVSAQIASRIKRNR